MVTNLIKPMAIIKLIILEADTSTKEIIRFQGQLPLTAYVLLHNVLPPSGRTDKLLPAEALTNQYICDMHQIETFTHYQLYSP